ncbi:MAG: GSCFA domain-containing protein [Reyranellaceae bacterium]
MTDARPTPSGKVEIVVNGETKRIGSSFYRGAGASYMPRLADIRKPSAIAEYILKGWMPSQPFIGPQTSVVAFGSCFAANVGRYLASIGYEVATRREGNAHIQRIGDGLVNVHSICQQFEWAWENKVPSVALWHGWKAEEFGYDEEIRLATRKLFDEADVFILTFGLSEIWYDEPSGEIFWRAVPQDKFDPERHKFRIATYAETVDCLRRIHALIRRHRPGARIIFTLSPIALTATFRDVSCITANAVSKGLLRAAIDEVYREFRPVDGDLYYFPAYEVVTQGFRAPFNEDLRHPLRHVIDCTMKAFERFFCQTGVSDEQLEAAVRDALARDELVLGLSAQELADLHRHDNATSSGSRGAAVDIEKKMQRERMVELARKANNERAESREARLKAREDRIKKREAMRAEWAANRAAKAAKREASRKQPPVLDHGS